MSMDVHRLSRQSPFHYLNTTLKIINKNVSMVRANWNSYIPQVLHKQFSMSTHTSIRGEQNKWKYENCPTALIRQNPSKNIFFANTQGTSQTNQGDIYNVLQFWMLRASYVWFAIINSSCSRDHGSGSSLMTPVVFTPNKLTHKI